MNDLNFFVVINKKRKKARSYRYLVANYFDFQEEESNDRNYALVILGKYYRIKDLKLPRYIKVGNVVVSLTTAQLFKFSR